jgi:hypothetical protein
MEKKSKCTEINNLNKADDYGNHNFIIKFENGDSGFFRTKDEKASQFEVGKEATYIFEEIPKKDGTGTYTKITLPKKPFNKGFVNTQLTIEEFVQREKIKAVTYSMSYAERILSSDKIKEEQLKATAKTILDWHITQMDKLLKKSE